MANNTETLLIDIQVNSDEATKKAGEQISAIAKLREETAKLKEENKAARKEGQDNSEQYKLNAEKIATNESKLKQLNNELTQNQKIIRATTTEVQGETGAYQQLQNQYSVAAQKAKDLAVAYGVGSEEAKKATLVAFNMSEKLKEVDKSVGQNQRSVGDYGIAMKGMAGALNGLPGAFGQMAQGANNAASGLKAMNTASPVGWVMIIVGLISQFTEKLQGNAEFAKKWSVFMAGFNAVFATLSGWITKAGLGIIDFTKSFTSFTDFAQKAGDAIKENILNRLESFSVMGKAIVKILSGDMKEGFKDLANGALQGATGVTDVIGKVGAVAKQVAKEVGDAMSEGERIATMTKKLTKMKRDQITELAALQVKEDEARQKIGKLGQSLSPEEQEKALAELDKFAKRRLQLQRNVAVQEQAIAQAQVNQAIKETGAATGDLKTALEERKAATIKVEGDIALLAGEIKARTAKLGARILDTEIANIKAVEEANKKSEMIKLNDSKATVDERVKSLDKIKAIQDSAFADEQKSFEKFANRKVDLNSLVEISDAKTMQEAINGLELNKVAQDKLIAVIGDRKKQIIETNEIEKQLLATQAEQLIKSLNYEMQLQKAHNEELRAGQKLTNEELHAQRLSDIKTANEKELKELQIQKEKQLITEDEYTEQVKLKNAEKNAAIATEGAAFADAEKQRKQQVQADDYTNELASLQEHSDRAIEIKMAQLDAQRTAELEAAELNGQNTTAIEEKYSNLKKKIAETELNHKLDQGKKIADGIATLFGKQTKVAKLASSASVAIDTYKGVTSALASMAGAGPVGWAMGAVEAGVIAASGVKSIADIWAVKSGLPEGGGGGGQTSVSAPAPVAGSMVSRSIGQSPTQVVEQGTAAALQQNQIVPVLVTSNLTDVQKTEVQVKSSNSL